MSDERECPETRKQCCTFHRSGGKRTLWCSGEPIDDDYMKRLAEVRRRDAEQAMKEREVRIRAEAAAERTREIVAKLESRYDEDTAVAIIQALYPAAFPKPRSGDGR